MSDRCHGNGDDHCCYIAGRVCVFLEEGTIPGRRWVCGLRRELGSWRAVYDDPRYAPVAQWWNENHPGFQCGDFPQDIPEIMNSPTAGKCCYG